MVARKILWMDPIGPQNRTTVNLFQTRKQTRKVYATFTEGPFLQFQGRNHIDKSFAGEFLFEKNKFRAISDHRLRNFEATDLIALAHFSHCGAAHGLDCLYRACARQIFVERYLDNVA